MKLAKRIFAILLLVTLSLSMVACAEANVLGVSTPTTPLAVSDGSTVSDTETPVAYRNDYFGYTCALPYDWYVYNRDEINQMIGIAKDVLDNSEAGDVIQESLGNGDTVLDFYAASGDGTQTINIVLGKRTPLELLLSEEKIIGTSIPILTDGLKKMGATEVTNSTGQVEFLGKNLTALYICGDFQGVSLYETIVLIHKGIYTFTFTVTSMQLDTTQELLQYFHPID